MKKEKNQPKKESGKEGQDYWDDIAGDAASGYRTEKDLNEVLNEDQLADDHERADKQTEEKK